MTAREEVLARLRVQHENAIREIDLLLAMDRPPLITTHDGSVVPDDAPRCRCTDEPPGFHLQETGAFLSDQEG